MIEGKIENSGIGVFPHSFGFFRFTSQIFLVEVIPIKKEKINKGKVKNRNTPIKEKEERKYAHVRLMKNPKTRLRDGGWEGNPMGARETGAVAVRLVVHFPRRFLLLSVFICTFVA